MTGFEAIAGAMTIPDAWFGDYESPLKGQRQMEIDPEHSLIWHPYVSAVDGMVLAHISVTRKFQKSSDYQQFMNGLSM